LKAGKIVKCLLDALFCFIFEDKLNEMKFVDVKNDVAFRKIFGNENKKVILISFLNAVLGLEGQDRVKEVTLLNPFQLPRIAGEKSSIIDVRATDEKGSTFIVEMQVAEPAGFDKRVLYYTSKDYAGQINIGEEYPKLRPVYFIGVLDFKYFSGKNYLSSHLIVDEETGECVFKDMKFRFIELPKFNKKVHELKNIIDKWTFFIKNADELEVMPDNVDDEGLKEAYEEAAQHNWTREEYDAYIYAGIREQDERGRVEKAEERKRNEMIIGMDAKGIPLSIIAEIANLDEATVAQIIESQ
jgi:predicted transposase/invertase (TIGR01784 family)